MEEKEKRKANSGFEAKSLVSGEICVDMFNRGKIAIVIYTFFSVLLIGCSRDDVLSDAAIAQKKARMEEWSNMQFGLFLHWGTFSVPPRDDDPDFGTDGDYSHGSSTMSLKDWREIYPVTKGPGLSSINWDPDRLCEMAKSVGMKYVILTIRHQNGFCLYPTEYASWTIEDVPADNDVVKQLKSSCDKYGLKFGFYIQLLFDMMDDGGYSMESWNGGVDPFSAQQHDRFIQNNVKLLDQLINDLHPYCIFYDGSYSATNQEITREIRAYMDENHPEIITNNRDGASLALPREPGYWVRTAGDYWSEEMASDDLVPWRTKTERCAVLNNWSYKPEDEDINEYPPLQDVLWDFFRTFSRGHNYLLNIGPRYDGAIPIACQEWFSNLHAWCNKYTYFNGCTATMHYTFPNFGKMLLKDNSLWCFVIPNERNETIYIDGVSTDAIKDVYVYDSHGKWNNYEIVSSNRIRVNNIPIASGDYYSVVRIDFNSMPKFDDYNYADLNTPISGCAFSLSKLVQERTDVGTKPDGSMFIYNAETEIITRFKWDGVSGDYSITINGQLHNHPTIDITILREKDIVVYSEDSLAQQVDIIRTKSNVPLSKGNIYTLKIKMNCDTNSDAFLRLFKVQFQHF